MTSGVLKLSQATGKPYGTKSPELSKDMLKGTESKPLPKGTKATGK